MSTLFQPISTQDFEEPDVILVIPEESRQALGEFAAKIYKKQNDALVNKIRVNAAGATFYQWLLPQIDRPDRVGDIARDAVNDNKFPRESIHYEEIKSYLVSVRACAAAIESMKESWLEYVQKYPERVQPFAWCSECGSKLDIEKAFLAWSLESQEMYVLDLECLHKYNQFDELAYRPLSGITKVDLEELIEKEDVSKFDVEDHIEQLTLWGILPLSNEEYGITNNGGKNMAISEFLKSRKFIETIE